MEMLHDMFPTMDASVLEAVLSECGGNVERAIDCLLNMESINTPANPTSNTSNAATSNNPATNTTTSHQISQLELDELMARQLANSMYQDSDYHADEMMQPRLHQQREQYTVALGELDGTVMTEIMNSVKSHMIPILVKQLTSVEIPAVTDQIDAGKLGLISFSLAEIQVGEADVPEKNVNIVMEGATVTISVNEITAKLQQFKWSYEKNSFPKLKDNGNADASLSDGTIIVKLVIGSDEYGNPNVAVTKCDVNIGNLDIKITGTLASFVYNTLLSIFKKSIKSTLETSLATMITDSINNDNSMNLF